METPALNKETKKSKNRYVKIMNKEKKKCFYFYQIFFFFFKKKHLTNSLLGKCFFEFLYKILIFLEKSKDI